MPPRRARRRAGRRARRSASFAPGGAEQRQADDPGRWLAEQRPGERGRPPLRRHPLGRGEGARGREDPDAGTDGDLRGREQPDAGAAALASEPSPSRIEPPSSCRPSATRPPRWPSASAVTPATRPAIVRSWPATAVETSRSRATWARTGESAIAPACPANRQRNRTALTDRSPVRSWCLRRRHHREGEREAAGGRLLRVVGR